MFQFRGKQKGATEWWGDSFFFFFFAWVIPMVATLSTWVAYGIGQSHRHFTAGQLAPRAKVGKGCRPGLPARQGTESQNVKQNQGGGPPEKQQHFRNFFLLGYVMCFSFWWQWNLQPYDRQPHELVHVETVLGYRGYSVHSFSLNFKEG